MISDLLSRWNPCRNCLGSASAAPLEKPLLAEVSDDRLAFCDVQISYSIIIILWYYRPKIQKHFGFQDQNMKCWGSSETRFGQVSGQSELSLVGKRPFENFKKFKKIDFSTAEKWNVGDRPKRVLAKFEADRSRVRGVNGGSKFVGDDVGPFPSPTDCRGWVRHL